MIPMTARSSTRVKAHCSRKGSKAPTRVRGADAGRKGGLVIGDWETDCSRKGRQGRDALTRGFLILYFGLAEEIGSCGAKAGMRGADAGKGTKEITIKISTPVIYIVNTSLQSKY